MVATSALMCEMLAQGNVGTTRITWSIGSVGVIDEVGAAFTDRQDDGAIGSDGVHPATRCPPGAPAGPMFVTIVRAAPGIGVALVGGSAVDPPEHVVDIAQAGRDQAAGMIAPRHQELRSRVGRPGEQPLGTAEVDHDAGRVDHDPPDVAGQCGTKHLIRVHDDASRGFTAPPEQVGGIAEEWA